jgi:chromosome segregation protein
MLKRLEVVGFKSFAKKTVLDFGTATTAIVGPNGSGKSNIAEAFRFALGEQSMKSMRGKRAEDLIWGGSHTTARSSRAGVAIVFDNTQRGERRPFTIDFDEVVIERVVTRDGTSEYSINGSRVRLRDVQELLAGANIGETEHHIISQGEADRILLASTRERRSLLEDALGLRVYEFKKRESEGKLVKTEENITQVNALRRELAPHLRFLARQVEKLERADLLRQELIALATGYFAEEDAYIASERAKVKDEEQASRKQLTTVSAELASIEEGTTTDAESTKRLTTLREAERELERLRGKKAELARELGRVEGALSSAKERSARIAREPYAKVPREELTALVEEVERAVGPAEDSTVGESVEALRATLAGIRTAVKAFVSRFVSPRDDLLSEEEQSANMLEDKQGTLARRDADLAASIEAAEGALRRAREALTAQSEASREERRRILGLAGEKAEYEAAVVRAEGRLRELTLLAEELDRAKAEAVAVAGREAVSYEPSSLTGDRKGQEERKRQLERLTIRLEEAGGTGEDIRQEHKEASEREAFLARELEDLGKSAEGLRELVKDLDAELAKHFTDGLAKVNASFNEYFALMFGGGSARLVLEESDQADEEDEEMSGAPAPAGKVGIEIAISLPKKKIRGLFQLSGGERALTSIALIFAMSQVNPPPFLILDETDAALDEANSRRYGEMIENLAKHSQLILITHNRETMSHAGILYGVTMGGDGVSKLLSVKFEEAVAVAK